MGTVLRPAEVARELRISRVTVYELIRRGELPATRVGHQFRIEASALATYRAEHHQGARPAQSTRQGTLVIRAEDHLLTLSVPDDLESLSVVELAEAFSRRAGVQRARYRGVLLHALLTAHGFLPASLDLALTPPPSPEHAAVLRSVVAARGRDDHVVAFSVAELLPEYGATLALIAWERDGEALRTTGPVQLVVPSDRLPTRGVRQLEAIDLHRLA
jgi:excisionase family DNA binding protein